MRTTITIDDRLLEALKRRAAETGSTVNRLIEDAVRLMLHGSAGVDSPEFELVIYGHGGRFTSHDADRTWTLLEQEDMERHGGVR